MQQYFFDVPDTQDAKTLLNIIIATGYFNQVKKVSPDTNPKNINEGTINTKNVNDLIAQLEKIDKEELEDYILSKLMEIDKSNETVSETEIFKILPA